MNRNVFFCQNILGREFVEITMGITHSERDAAVTFLNERKRLSLHSGNVAEKVEQFCLSVSGDMISFDSR